MCARLLSCVRCRLHRSFAQIGTLSSRLLIFLWFVVPKLDGKAMLRVGKTGDWVGTFLGTGSEAANNNCNFFYLDSFFFFVVPSGHKGAVYGAQLNKNATKAITGSADYTAKVW